MEQNPQLDKYTKAKIEEPNLRLPKALLRANLDRSTGELYYINIFEDDTKKSKHLAEEIAAGAKLDRKVYRVREEELLNAVKYEEMQRIHRVSKATIGLVTDCESELHGHLFLDLIGTVEQVKTAEELILDKIIERYQGSVYPVILMPPTVYGHRMRLHVGKVLRLLGKGYKNSLAVQVASGAWLQVFNPNDEASPGGPQHERIVYIYGPKAHVVKAVSLVYSQVYEPGESLEAEEELETLFKELSFTEMMEGITYGTPQTFAFASDSGSGQTEEQKEQKQLDKV